MKKMIRCALALMIAISTAIPVHAVTPKLNIPDVPKLSKITVNSDGKKYENAVRKWLTDHPIKLDLSGFPGKED